MPRSILKRGVCLAAMTLVATSALAQTSLPTINVGVPQAQRVTQKPRAGGVQTGLRLRLQNPNPGQAVTTQAITAPGFGNNAGREQIFNNPTGQAVTEISGSDVRYIQGSPQRTLSQTLKFSPGVSVTPLGGGNEEIISIRGSGANPNARPGGGRNFRNQNIVVMSDGFPVTTGDGYTRTALLDPHSFGGVEVFRGGSSALLGNYALYGGMNVKSYSGEEIDGGEIASEGGSFAYVNNYARLGKKYSLKNFGDLDIAFFGSDVRNNGWIPHTDSQAQTGHLLVKYSPNTVDHLTLKYMFNNTFAEQNGPFSQAQFAYNPYQGSYGCPIAAVIQSNNPLCVVRTAPGNGIIGLPGGQPQSNPAALRNQSYESLGIHSHVLQHLAGVRYQHEFSSDTVWSNQFTYNYIGTLSGVQPPQAGGFGGPVNFLGPTYNFDARTDITSNGTLLGHPIRHFLGFIYNDANTTNTTYANMPNAWYYGVRGAWEGKINSETKNFNIRGREELALSDNITAVAGASVNWNRIVGTSYYNNWQVVDANYYKQVAWGNNGFTNTIFGRLQNKYPFNLAVDKTYVNWAPEGSLTYRLTPEVTLRTRGYGAYSTPAFESLTNNINGAGANTGLKAQTSIGVDGGIDWTPHETTKISITYFNEWFRNELLSRISPYNVTISYMDNVPKTIHRGVETGFDVRPIEGWRFYGAYTFYDFQYAQYDDLVSPLNSGGKSYYFNRANYRLPGQPSHVLTARGGYDIPHGDLKGLGGFLEYNFRSATPTDVANLVWAPGYGLLNANLHYDLDKKVGMFKSMNAYLEVSNLIGTTYAAGAYTISNTQLNGIMVPQPLLASQGNYVIGQPRSVVAGVKLKF